MNYTFNPPRLTDWAKSVREDPVPTWLVEPFIPNDNLVLISGHPKSSKKTWLAMYLALEASKRGHRVLIIYREGARKPTLARFEALIPEEDRACFDDIYFHHRGNFWLDEGQWVKNARVFIEKHKIALVFIDTFAKSVQADENSSRDVGKAVNAAERLRDAGATIVLVHHLRKANFALSNGASGSPEPDKDLRGSSALAGAYETHLAVRSYNGNEPILLVSSKEADIKAYTYQWEFNSEDNKLLSVIPVLAPMDKLPIVEGKEGDE